MKVVKVAVDFNDRRQHVFPHRGERHFDVCVTEVDRFGKASTMVLGGISHYGKTNLVFINQCGAQWPNGRQRQQGLTARRYLDDILRPVVVPYLAAHPVMIMLDLIQLAILSSIYSRTEFTCVFI